MTLPPDDNGSDDVNNAIGDVDPMKWLESLAARQGANPEEFVTSADLDVPETDPNAVLDEPGYEDYDPLGGSASSAAAPPPAPEAEPEPVVMEADADDSADDSDNPMAWLESLARRQGANPDEFMTDANMEVEEIDPDSVVLDEPGYTPYDGMSVSAPASPPPAPKPEPVLAAEPAADEPLLIDDSDLSAADAAALLGMDTDQMAPVQDAPVPAEPVPAAKAAPVDAGDPTGGDVDPLAWLESLAKRQGAKPEELITTADLDVPEAAADAVADEPGYVDYSPFGPSSDAVAAPEEDLAVTGLLPEHPDMVVEEAPSGDDTLSWLENLAAEQDVEVQPELFTDDPLGGISDDELERMAAAGELSGVQMQAWLDRQADSLAQTRVDATPAEPVADLAPPEPGEIPAWLQDAMPTGDEPAVVEPEPLVDEIIAPPEPAELPDWLHEPEAVADDADLLSALVEDTDDVEDDGLDVPVEPGASDSWVQALDHEYLSEQIEGDVPDWYQAALDDPEREAAVEAQETLPEQAAEIIEEEIEPAVELAAAEVPEWLAGAAPDDEVVAADVPDWLTEAVDEEAEDGDISWLKDEVVAEEAVAEEELAAADIPSWLQDAAAEEVEVPGWLADAAPDADAAAVPEVDVPAEAPMPAYASTMKPSSTLMPVLDGALTAIIPDNPSYDKFRDVLADAPQDHATRLTLARQLVQDNRALDGLGQYEALVFAEVMLEELERDLQGFVKAQPRVPQARRVLGDVYMRQGRLQDALSTYRAALEQL